jgi:hypothetical protein
MNIYEFWKAYAKMSLVVDGLSSLYGDKLPECFGDNRDDILNNMYDLNTNYKKLYDVERDINLFVDNANLLIIGLEKYNDNKFSFVIDDVKKYLK